jgi:2-iminobutanoate/2-iminopropanoate deaminase
MTRTIITTDEAPAVPGHVPLVQGLRIGNLLHAAGQVGQDPQTGELVSGGVAAQAERTLLNVRAILEAAGASFRDVLMMRVYLTDAAHFPELNEVYRRIVGDEPPPRTTICVDLPGDFLIEVDALAVL